MTIPAHISSLLRAHTCEVIRQIPDLKDRDDRFPTDLACVVLVAGQGIGRSVSDMAVNWPFRAQAPRGVGVMQQRCFKLPVNSLRPSVPC